MCVVYGGGGGGGGDQVLSVHGTIGRCFPVSLNLAVPGVRTGEKGKSDGDLLIVMGCQVETGWFYRPTRQASLNVRQM